MVKQVFFESSEQFKKHLNGKKKTTLNIKEESMDNVETVTLELIMVNTGEGEGPRADTALLDTVNMNVLDKLVKDAPFIGTRTTKEEKSEESEILNESLGYVMSRK